MTRLVNRAENWEIAYQAFESINFAAYTYDSIKQAMVDYVREYHSSLFNDFIESSELVAIIELFAYLGELLAYRYDLNAHENFLSTAQRKESVLRLAKYLSYSASRNLPARGLVKITSISTTENVFDSTGTNLANTTIRWNDSTDVRWRERFLLVMNRVLAREYGNVAPSDRVQVNDAIFEQYLLNSVNVSNALPYTITVNGEVYDMELVSAFLTANGPEERRPAQDNPFAVLFADDGLGDDSEFSGFFCLTKQGTLQRRTIRFDGITPNHTVDVEIDGINDIDVWLNNIDSNGRPVVDPSTGAVVGLWERVDNATAENIIFNGSATKNLYEVETLNDDRVRLIFGDGEFASIPNGLFELWVRTSEHTRDIVVPKSSISEQPFVITYQDSLGQVQTLRFTVSATTSLQNAASSESIERIKKTAPAVYYAQDRMVNARDYNSFPLRDNSIFKLRSINRTFAGDSKYLHWHDPRENYENVKIFGDDLVLYWDTDYHTETLSGTLTPAGLVANAIEPLLASVDFTTLFVIEGGISPTYVRTAFTTAETASLVARLKEIINAAPGTMYGRLNATTSTQTGGVWSFTQTRPTDLLSGQAQWWFRVTTLADGTWEVTHQTKRLVAHSANTKFWNTNTSNKVLTYDTYNTNSDTLAALSANTTSTADGIVGSNINFNVVAQATQTVGEEKGLPDIHKLVVVPTDTTGDQLPDNLVVQPLMPNPLSDLEDERDYVYFHRESLTSPWVVQEASEATLEAYYQQFGMSYNPTDGPAVDTTLSSITGSRTPYPYGPVNIGLWKREIGRTGLNFLWMHRTPRYHLIDPSTTNLIDMFVMTRGYFQAYDLWLSGRFATEPQPPKSVELRTTYKPILEHKMVSDTVIFLPGKIKTIINGKSDPQVRAKIKVVKAPTSLLTNSEIKVRVVEACREFFDLNNWEFGETFYFTELATAVHNALLTEIDSVVLVPDSPTNSFGDGFQIFAREDEIIYGFVTPRDVEIVQSLDPRTLRQNVRP